MPSRIPIDMDQLKSLCAKWRVRELSLFGSVLRDDFSPSSDVDVMVSFEPSAPWNLWELMDMKAEMEALFGRSVDIVEREALRNPWRRQEILNTHEVVYAA
ncbi:MAG TPA: nucleotidyltransferase domain-containing protein [Candidatus Hydrogenedentes bacterium]|nr:nucleotidyltransferase domain-containing protein [Candidatus Hydrogenedentota bacterium]HOS01664.1 nucleotidyltransferase domain-containing protein [Candidatus Hydrogenedentota bacterium]